MPPLRYDRHTHTLSLGDADDESVARIAGAGVTGGRYDAWFEQVPGTTPGSWTDSGRDGTTAGPLYELNGYADVPLSRVRFWKGLDGNLYFEKRSCP